MSAFDPTLIGGWANSASAQAKLAKRLSTTAMAFKLVP